MNKKRITDSEGKIYTIRGELGRGGFGVVYIASDEKSKMHAIKFIGPIDESETIESFKREIQTATKLEHPNILKFIGHGECKDKNKTYFFTVTEYCPGGNYRQIFTGRTFSLEIILSEFKQILTGLSALHQYVVHRDIKPENILLAGAILKVADFGLSKSIDEATKSLTFKGSGTPRYMAPEVWERRKIYPTTDLYAIGVMLFEAITGQVPFEAEDIVDLRNMHLYNPAPRIKSINKDVPDYIDGIIKKLLEKDSTKRYQSAQELLNVLKPTHDSSSPNSVLILRERIRKTHDSIESRQLEEKRTFNKVQEKQKRIEYMEQQLISQIDESVKEINEGLEETKVTSDIRPNSAHYSFNGRTLSVIFFRPNALYNNNTLPALHKELEKHFATHAGSIYIEENGEDREGWNIVLIQSPENPYGEWLLIESNISALSGHTLKHPPAATDENLLSENLAYHWMCTMHVWILKDKPLEHSDIEKILDKFIL